MIDVSSIKHKNLWKSNWDAMHNPTRGVCVPSFLVSCGVDYMSSLSRLNRCLGPIECYQKRNSDTR